MNVLVTIGQIDVSLRAQVDIGCSSAFPQPQSMYRRGCSLFPVTFRKLSSQITIRILNHYRAMCCLPHTLCAMFVLESILSTVQWISAICMLMHAHHANRSNTHEMTNDFLLTFTRLLTQHQPNKSLSNV